MSSSSMTNPDRDSKDRFDFPKITSSERQQAIDLLPKLMSRLAPQWPLRDFVAVNPLHGYNDMSLLQAMQELQKVRDAELLMPLAHYRQHFVDGMITKEGLQRACESVRESFEVLLEAYNVKDEDIIASLETEKGGETRFSKEYRTFAEQVDYTSSLRWESIIVEEISRHCSAYYAEEGTSWDHPYKERGLYYAWQALKQVDYRMDWLGIAGFRQAIQELPESPIDCIVALLRWFDVPAMHWKGFLLAQWNSVVGWASYIQGKQFGVVDIDLEDNDLVGLLAIRLAYDACLTQKFAGRYTFRLWPEQLPNSECETSNHRRLVSDLARYVGLIACEEQYRSRLKRLLSQDSNELKPQKSTFRTQMVFCIDVRSEVLRRQIEAVSPEIETFGFAGFFGLPFQFHSSQGGGAANQCPVLLSPKFLVHETCASAGCGCGESAVTKRNASLSAMFGRLTTSAVGCFGYIESLGVSYLPKIVQRMLPMLAKRASDKDQIREGDSQRSLLLKRPNGLGINLDLAQRVELAKGILHNLGIKDRLASLVVFVGHGSHSTNNPFQASLDCGACGGHSGESNARLAAQLLNDSDVRASLKISGVVIPEKCWFVAGLHNTTTDEISLFEEDGIPSFAREEMNAIRLSLPQATQRAQEERNLRFGNPAHDNVYRRAMDWSEVRPEWGLVNNAAFIAAPRGLTKNCIFDGRAFLHSYDPATDPDGSILELVLTAPVVVAHWINTQYYFSTVDPQAFGSGNKVLHSVVGGIGVFEGNGGDLKTGLPWQSVHDGKKFQHEPLRLSVVLYAGTEAIDRVIERHGIVKNLVGNSWIHISAWGQDGLHERKPEGGWVKAF